MGRRCWTVSMLCRAGHSRGVKVSGRLITYTTLRLESARQVVRRSAYRFCAATRPTLTSERGFRLAPGAEQLEEQSSAAIALLL